MSWKRHALRVSILLLIPTSFALMEVADKDSINKAMYDAAAMIALVVCGAAGYIAHKASSLFQPKVFIIEHVSRNIARTFQVISQICMYLIINILIIEVISGGPIIYRAIALLATIGLCLALSATFTSAVSINAQKRK